MMAARRVAKSAVDWTAFASLVPKNQAECYKAFKTKSDMFVSRVHKYPENMAKIDFASYKSRVSDPSMVEALEKAYASVTVPYPKDKDNLKAAIEAEEKEEVAKKEKFIAEAQEGIKDLEHLLQKIEELPHVEEMTLEMYRVYYPPTVGSDGQPALWPFTKSQQPNVDPKEIKTNILLPKSMWERDIGDDKRYLW